MKRFTLLLATMLLSVMSYAADEVYKTALFGSSYNSKGVQNYTSEWSATNNGFTVDIVNANNNNNGWSYIKMGSKNAASVGTITTHVAIDEAITKVVLTIDAVTTNSINSVKLKTSPDSVTWTEAGSFTVAKGDQTVSLTTPTPNLYYQVSADCKKSSNGVITISKVEYYKAAPAAAVADPIISAKNNEVAIENNGFYTSALTITLTCATEGAAIHYTLDGSEPTAESATYSEALTFANEFVTLRAKAFKGEDASYEATANYYHNSSLEVPYTTTQAVALYNALGDVSNIYVAGAVTGTPSYNTSTSTSNYNITDGETTLYIYKGTSDVASGLTDIANLVEGDKVIVKGDITKYNSTFELNSGNTIVKWTENTDPVLTCAESIAFGNISSLVGTAPSKTLTVTAKNLTEDITVTLSDGAAFTLDESEFDVRNGGTLTITPILTIGENTATLTLTSGETSATVTLTATIKQAYTISWSVNGKVTSTSAVIDGENLVLPATPEAPNDCASKVFVGWATTATVAADGKDIVFVDAATPATADATYYAVFATATESETPAVAEVTFSNMFSDVTSSKDIDGVALGIKDGITVTFAKSSSGSNKAQYYDNGKAVRLYGGGSITINSLATITSFTLTFGTGEDSNPNTFTADGGTWESPTWTGSANTIVLTESGTTGHRRVAGISVTYKQTTWEEYATTCEDTPSAIESTAAEKPAVKTIENGQLVILRDGVKYNAMGVRLQ